MDELITAGGYELNDDNKQQLLHNGLHQPSPTQKFMRPVNHNFNPYLGNN